MSKKIIHINLGNLLAVPLSLFLGFYPVYMDKVKNQPLNYDAILFGSAIAFSIVALQYLKQVVREE